MEIDSLTNSQLTKNSFVENMIGLKLSKDFSMPELQSLISEIQFKDKKKADMTKALSKTIETMTSSTIQSSKENQDSKFFKVVKLENRTRSYNTAEKDEISPTMFAYYFCDKSKQNLSDKEAAAMKSIHIEPNYDIPIEQKKKDDDELSTISNPFNSASEMRLKKKRKSSFSTNNAKSNKKRKIERKESDEEMNNEKEYCLPTCIIGRNNTIHSMVCCDRCETWFHTKCLNIPDEQFNKIKDTEWFCPNCSKKEDKNNPLNTTN